jgi:periplasmic divalent cation tolerance protein
MSNIALSLTWLLCEERFARAAERPKRKRKTMNPGDFGVVTTTVAEREDAERLAGLLLLEKLAACVQIQTIDSRYVWKGESNHQTELMLLIKTRAALFDSVIARLIEEHPYETPEIVATVFAAGFAGYFDWIADSTRPA